MSKIRLIVLSMLAVFAASMVASASASAANGCLEATGEKCLWTLEGKALGVGEERTLKRQWNSLQTLKGTAGGAAVTLSSKLVDFQLVKIIGGIPGTDTGKLLFLNVQVVKPTGCAVNKGTVITNLLKTELVELVKGTTNTGKTDILFEPNVAGGNFAELEFEDNPSCSLKGVKANVEGTVQAEITSHAEETSHTLKAQGAEAWSFRRRNDVTATASQLKLAGKAATFEGTTNAALEGGGKFGTD